MFCYVTVQFKVQQKAGWHFDQSGPLKPSHVTGTTIINKPRRQTEKKCLEASYSILYLKEMEDQRYKYLHGLKNGYKKLKYSLNAINNHNFRPVKCCHQNFATCLCDIETFYNLPSVI